MEVVKDIAGDLLCRRTVAARGGHVTKVPRFVKIDLARNFFSSCPPQYACDKSFAQLPTTTFRFPRLETGISLPKAHTDPAVNDECRERPRPAGRDWDIFWEFLQLDRLHHRSKRELQKVNIELPANMTW
jgi:hypothetical protein